MTSSKVVPSEANLPHSVSRIRPRLSYAVSNLYVKNYFDVSAKHQADELVRYIREEFRHILDTIDWMDPETVERARKKADAIRPQIGFPDELLIDQKLTDHYGDVSCLECLLVSLILIKLLC